MHPDLSITYRIDCAERATGEFVSSELFGSSSAELRSRCRSQTGSCISIRAPSLVNNHLGETVSQDINVVALVKGEERYIFLFNDNQKSKTLRTLGRYASDSKLSFSWYDAAVLSQKVRNIDKGEAAVPAPKGSARVGKSTSSLLPPNKFNDIDGDLLSEEDLFSGEDMF